MAQFIKVSGIVENYEKRPIITVVGKEPKMLLDARRYNFQDGEKLNSVQAIGSLSSESIKLLSTGVVGPEFSNNGIKCFKFDGKTGFSSGNTITIDDEITAVVVYKIETWNGTYNSNRIYSVGDTKENRSAFFTQSYKLAAWSGDNAETIYRYDNQDFNWAVGVHYFNGKDSVVIDRFGGVHKIVLGDRLPARKISVWSSVVAPSPTVGAVAYLAIYEGKMSEEDLMNLFLDAKSNFDIL